MKFNSTNKTVNYIESAIDLKVTFNEGYTIELSSEYLELIDNIKTRLLKIYSGNRLLYSSTRKKEIIEINSKEDLFIEYDLVFIENGQEFTYYGSTVVKPTTTYEVIDLATKTVNSDNLIGEIQAILQKINNLSLFYDIDLKKYVSLQNKIESIDAKIKTIQTELSKKT